MLKEELLCNPREENGVVIYEKPWVVDIKVYWEAYVECSCIAKCEDDSDSDGRMLCIVARASNYDNNENLRVYKIKNYPGCEYGIMVGMDVDNLIGGLL